MADVRERIVEAVAAAATAHALWKPDAALVVAVSGGADSLCLLGALCDLRAASHAIAPGRLIVAHLDHGMRGEHGAADAARTGEIAASLGLEYVTERVDVPRLARTEHRSLEDAARRARYAFLRRTRHDTEADRIVTGHTRDDQAETIVMHFLRGSGIAGLTGMAPLAGDVARPLLDVPRAETEAYCAERGWEPAEDASNTDLRLTRNRVRLRLLPELERYNPNLRETLIRNAALLAADEAYLEERAEAAWAETAHYDATSGEVTFALRELREQPVALRHRLYRKAARLVVDTDNLLEARHLQLLDDLLANGHGGSTLHLPGGLRVVLGYATLTFAHHARQQTRAEAPSMVSPEVPLPLPGEVALPGLGWRIRSLVMDVPAGLESGLPQDPFEAPQLAYAGLVGAELERAEMRAYLDADAARGPLSVRTWRPGDRFRPLGLAAEKKLQDYFSDAKVPRPLRSRLPLVFGRDHLLWVAGQRIDDRARITPDTRRILVLQLEPLPLPPPLRGKGS